MINYNLYNLIDISVENPFKEWKKCKKYFKFPRIKFKFKNTSDHIYSSLIDVKAYSMFWKSKYDEWEFENEPYASITFFKKWSLIMDLKVPYKGECEDICYWEGMLKYIQMLGEGKSPQEALYISYKYNVWNKMNPDGTVKSSYDIKPFLNNLGFHTLESMIAKHNSVSKHNSIS